MSLCICPSPQILHLQEYCNVNANVTLYGILGDNDVSMWAYQLQQRSLKYWILIMGRQYMDGGGGHVENVCAFCTILL
jgi:hypothetical protein